VIVTLVQDNATSAVLDRFTEAFRGRIDDLQAILDRGHFCSEIHCIVGKR
jgi:hypothetical protein